MGNPVDAEQVCDLWPIQRPGPSQSKACRQRHRGEQDGARAIAVWLTQHQNVIAIAAQDIRQARRLPRQRAASHIFDQMCPREIGSRSCMA